MASCVIVLLLTSLSSGVRLAMVTIVFFVVFPLLMFPHCVLYQRYSTASIFCIYKQPTTQRECYWQHLPCRTSFLSSSQAPTRGNILTLKSHRFFEQLLLSYTVEVTSTWILHFILVTIVLRFFSLTCLLNLCTCNI